MADQHTEVRPAEAADAAEIARLAGVLGYPAQPEAMAGRLASLLPSTLHYIAVLPNGAQLSGWMHVEHRCSLEGGERAELMGLVVDAAARRRGYGRNLVAAAERWARARGLAALTIRSNIIRELAHAFYESLGYSRSKTQHVYTKRLVTEGR